MKLEGNDAAFFSTGGYFLDGFDESYVLDIVCICISPLSFDFGRMFLPVVLV